jgi:hypothetical protein
MTKLNFTTKNAIALYAMLAVVFSSCDGDTESKRVVTEARVTQNYEEIGYPVKLHYIERSGMKYMIASGQYGEAGVSICNLTLDSLQVEFYKRSLK